MNPIDDDLPVQDELATLKARADMLGISYHPSIGVDKLKAKIEDALASNDNSSEQENSAQPAEVLEESPESIRARKRREAAELVRIRVTCMNPAKKEWEGEIFTAGNSLVGTFSKYVPFGAEDGWHVPRIIYNQIVQRQCQIFETKRDARGNAFRKGKLIREFAVEVLPQLSKAELQELARRQAMAKSID